MSSQNCTKAVWNVLSRQLLNYRMLKVFIINIIIFCIITIIIIILLLSFLLTLLLSAFIYSIGRIVWVFAFNWPQSQQFLQLCGGWYCNMSCGVSRDFCCLFRAAVHLPNSSCRNINCCFRQFFFVWFVCFSCVYVAVFEFLRHYNTVCTRNVGSCGQRRQSWHFS